MDNQIKAYSFAAATVLFWGTSASAFKLSLRHLGVDELVFYASLVSLLALAAIVWITGRLRELHDWSWRDYAQSAMLGFLNPFLYYLILLRAYSLLPAQEAQPLNFTWPIVLVLLSVVILRQRIGMLSLLAMTISFAGVVVISTRGAVLDFRITDGLGVTLALASTVVWALYWLYGVRDRRDPVVRLCLNFAFGCAFVLAYLLLVADRSGWPPASGLLGAAWIGLFEMGITFVLWLQALKLSRTTAQVSNFIYLTPFCSLLIIHFMVGEPIYPSTVTGLVLIVAGLILQQYGGQLIDGARARYQSG